MKLPGRLLTLAFILTAAVTLDAAVTLPSVFSDHMVLQQGKPIRLWGWAQHSQTVEVTLGTDQAQAKADASGKWEVTFPARTAGEGPLTLKVTQGNTITLEDILIGEVWLCSGQSNMGMNLIGCDNGKEEVTKADYPHIRLLMVPPSVARVPGTKFKGAWAPCTPSDPTLTGTNAVGSGAFSAVAYFFGRELHRELNVPVGLIDASMGNTRIEGWIPPGLPNAASGYTMYNAMIAPLEGFGIRGVLWYQGESNSHDGAAYAAKLKTLISGWRARFQQGDVPFYFVQIAPFLFRMGHDTLPIFWEAQTAALALPNTGMIGTQDIGTPNNIHPTNKLDVGKRLALLALAKTYGKNVVCSGPTFSNLTAQGDTLRLTFANVGTGLASRDGKPLTHFEVIDANGTGWKPAKAVISGTDAVVLSAAGVTRPVAMRFGWDSGAQPNLANKERLPAMTFRAGEAPKPVPSPAGASPTPKNPAK